MDTATTFDQRTQTLPPPVLPPHSSDAVFSPGSLEQADFPGSLDQVPPWMLEPPDPGGCAPPGPFDPWWDVEDDGFPEVVVPAENPVTMRTVSTSVNLSSVFEANRTATPNGGSAAGRLAGISESVAEAFSGFLALEGVQELGPDTTGSALQGLRRLEGWTAAGRARLVHRQHLLMQAEVSRFRRQREAEVIQRSIAGDTRDARGGGRSRGEGKPGGAGKTPGIEKARGGKGRGNAKTAGSDRSLAFSLAAAEIGTLLGIPEGTAMALIDESDQLCIRCPETLAQLESGAITLAQARTILDQTESLTNPDVPAFGTPAPDEPGSADGPGSPECPEEPDAGDNPGAGSVAGGVPVFPAGAARELEQELLVLAPCLTNAQLQRKARRLRERRYPHSIPVRHRVAFEERRVWFQPRSDGMGQLGAYLPAQQGQQILGALTGAARGEQAAGDPRALAQLRADILTSLLLHTDEPWPGTPADGTEAGMGTGIGTGTGTGKGTAAGRPSAMKTVQESAGTEPVRNSGEQSVRENAGLPGIGTGDAPPLPVGAVAEIMVLISAETLFGANDDPAELAGYGPISAEAARRLARTACRWTGLVQDPGTGQVLGVGRRRKVPGGLRRWLQARDQTCRFPGCGTGTARTEIDHTIDWAAGGATEHWNLAHLCRKHHLFKTLGHWKARQVSPGVLEWISPQGRRYTTEPELTLAPRQHHRAKPETPDTPETPEMSRRGSPELQPAPSAADEPPPF